MLYVFFISLAILPLQSFRQVLTIGADNWNGAFEAEFEGAECEGAKDG